MIMKNELVVMDSSLDGVIDDAVDLGKKYLRASKEATNTKSASLALSVAERAFALASKVGKDTQEASDVSSHQFITKIKTRVNRAQLWSAYLDHCEEHELLPLKKGEFFLKLAQYNFKTKKSDGINWVIPPDWNDRMKQII